MMLVRLGSVGLYVITKGMVSVRLVIVFLIISASDRGMSEARCTVEPRITATSIIRPPRYCGHFSLARQKGHTFSYRKPSLM